MTCSRNIRAAGFSLVELLIALSLLSVVLVKATMVMRATGEVASRSASSLITEDKARIVLDRIALAVMSCDRESVAPLLNPGHSTEINYQVSLGVEAGEVVWNEPERITLAGATNNQVLWLQSPDLPGERSVVWSNRVLPLLEGELQNGVDDNGNGLIDEQGLTFFVEGNQVTIRLCLGLDLEGGTITRSVETTVTIRNNPLDP